MLLRVFHTDQANLSQQNVNGVQSQRGRAERPLWYTWSRLHTWGLSSPQSQKVLVMCSALCDRTGQTWKLITQCYQSSSLNASDSLLSVFLDGCESSSAHQNVSFFLAAWQRTLICHHFMSSKAWEKLPSLDNKGCHAKQLRTWVVSTDAVLCFAKEWPLLFLSWMQSLFQFLNVFQY